MQKLGYQIKFCPEQVARLREKARFLSCALGKNVSWHELVRLGCDLVADENTELVTSIRRPKEQPVT
jgi:hypothetical protein